MPGLNMRLVRPRAVIDINRLPGMDSICIELGGLTMGALARQEALERSALVAAHAPLIAAAMPHVGHSALRARGTLGGSLAHADPAAELPACAVALGATVRIAGRRGARDVPADDFFRSVGNSSTLPAAGAPCVGRITVT